MAIRTFAVSAVFVKAVNVSRAALGTQPHVIIYRLDAFLGILRRRQILVVTFFVKLVHLRPAIGTIVSAVAPFSHNHAQRNVHKKRHAQGEPSTSAGDLGQRAHGLILVVRRLASYTAKKSQEQPY